MLAVQVTSKVQLAKVDLTSQMVVSLVTLVSHSRFNAHPAKFEILLTINKHIILTCSQEVQRHLTDLNFNLLSQTLQKGLQNVELSVFDRQIKAVSPLLLIPTFQFDQEQVSQINPDLTSQATSDKFATLSVMTARSLLECILNGLSFKNEDLLEEHLDNPGAIKQIALCATSLAIGSPENLFAFLKTSLAEVISRMSQESETVALQKEANCLSWLVHLLRVLFSQLVHSLNETNGVQRSDASKQIVFK